jgi:3-isopropylmalate/(R)-2-methylmalate dehydratase small subunit
VEPFTRLVGVAAPLDRPNVDTDQIIPKQFLKRIERSGYGPFLFYDWRYQGDGVTENPDFELNREPWRHAPVLLAGRNFGCGSSREHAAWALEDYGVRAVIAPSFSDIFRSNALKIGLLPVQLPEEVVARWMDLAREEPGLEATPSPASRRSGPPVSPPPPVSAAEGARPRGSGRGAGLRGPAGAAQHGTGGDPVLLGLGGLERLGEVVVMAQPVVEGLAGDPAALRRRGARVALAEQPAEGGADRRGHLLGVLVSEAAAAAGLVAHQRGHHLAHRASLVGGQRAEEVGQVVGKRNPQCLGPNRFGDGHRHLSTDLLHHARQTESSHTGDPLGAFGLLSKHC